MVVDSQLRILHANRRLAEAVEHTDDKPLRFEHLPRSLATGVYDVIKRGSSASQAVMLRTGRNETYRASVEPFQLSSTAGPAVLVLTQNFTDVEANRTLAVRNEREELLARMGAQFAHVVRNSLTQLSTVAQLLPTKHQDAEFVADVCSRMPAELGRLLRTADQLEWLNRDVGQSTEIDIAERIEAIWPAAKQFAGAQATETIRLLPAPTTVLCDPNALDRILLEVLTNAAQAASSTGKIEITADEPATDSVTIHVHDDGPGLSEEALRRGSEAFYTTKTSGMGLGLTVVERLLRAHSGKLTLTTSRRLRGADVALTLPTHRP